MPIFLLILVHLDRDASMDGSSLYEGDMMLTPEQRMAADLGLDVDKPFGRGANRGRQWPKGVLIYAIDPALGTFVVFLNAALT